MNRQDTSFTRRIGTVALIAVGVWLIAGCSSTTSNTGAEQITTATNQPSRSPQPTALTERANNTTVRVHTGQIVQLTLRSLYWADPVSTSTGVLALDDAVSRTPDHRGPIGSGSGTVVARFRASGPGTARIQTHRSSCGEAMGCRPGQSDFSVTIVAS
jgi:PBP1b-binding outer membrane lipoprotein LpoB